MKTTSWKKYLIFCVSFTAVFFGEIAVNIACGPEIDPYDYFVSYFHNNVQGDEYKPFSFTEMVNLYSEEEVQSEAEINSAEWAKYLNVKKEDVQKVMYGVNSATSKMLSNFGASVILPDSLKYNTFLKSLLKNNAAKKYYLFAKSVEPLVTVAYNQWEMAEPDSILMATTANKAVVLANQQTDDFLKIRYAYQALRLNHYSKNYRAGLSVYQNLIQNNKIKSAVHGWALAVYAGAVRYAGKPDEAAYLFAKVFASSPERRIQAYKNYFYVNPPLQSVLNFTKNDFEKATVYAIYGFGNPKPDLESLQLVYTYAPNSLINGALLVREVNKLEQALIKQNTFATNETAFYYSLYDNENKNRQQNINLKHLQAVQDFALKLANEKQYPQPELGTITAAYLAWMSHKPTQALAYLQSLKNTTKLTTRLKYQIKIIQLLIAADNIKKGSKFNEAQLVPVLKWLDEKRFAENKIKPQNIYDWSYGENRFTITTRNFYQHVLAPAYAQMGDTARAALAIFKGDLKYSLIKKGNLSTNMSSTTVYFWQNELSAKTLVAMLKLKANPQSDNLDGMLSEGLTKINTNAFYELLGTAYLRQQDYKNALTNFNKIGPKHQYFTPSNWYSETDDQKLYANPFIETINDYPKKYIGKALGITKIKYAKEMLRLQTLSTTDKRNAALYYYKMANAIYQTGSYGNSWFLVDYDWTAYRINTVPIKAAKALYLKAINATKDINLKAKCTFMLAKCQQKDFVKTNNGYVDFYQDEKESLWLNYHNPYFKELQKKYAKTPFYKIAANECSYFKEFIKAN